jgi:dipeptidyl-peptidase-4
LAQREYVDATRVGITGHSYGGYLAALGILKYPDVFHVAVAGAPVTDWRNYDTIYTERFMRTPQENPEGYAQGSCLTFAEQLKGKLLLLHGMEDDNVHPSNSWQLIHKLQQARKPFDMMFFPTSGHGIGSPSHNAVKWEYLVEHLVNAQGS